MSQLQTGLLPANKGTPKKILAGPMPFYCRLTQPNKLGGRCKLGLCLQVLSQGKRKKHMFLVHFSSATASESSFSSNGVRGVLTIPPLAR